MSKPDYFALLDQLAKNAFEAVELACGENKRECSEEKGEKNARNEKKTENGKRSLSELRVDSDGKVCALEDALFSDFIPPLQRDNIASLSHGLSRVIARAEEHGCTAREKNAHAPRQSEEERLCIELAQKLWTATAMLRDIRSPDKIPELEGFRRTLRLASEAHSAYLSRISSGMLPRSCAYSAFSCARVRFELSRCFDELIEVMLGNI